MLYVRCSLVYNMKRIKYNLLQHIEPERARAGERERAYAIAIWFDFNELDSTRVESCLGELRRLLKVKHIDRNKLSCQL